MDKCEVKIPFPGKITTTKTTTTPPLPGRRWGGGEPNKNHQSEETEKWGKSLLTIDRRFISG